MIYAAADTSSSSAPQPPKAELSETESDTDDEEHVAETDRERRQAMLDATEDSDMDNLKFNMDGFEFNFPGQDDCDTLTIRTMGSTFTTAGSSGKGKAKYPDQKNGDRYKMHVVVVMLTIFFIESSQPAKRLRTIKDSSSSAPKKQPVFGLGNLVKNEVELRKKESIGLALMGKQRLGSTSSSQSAKIDEKRKRASTTTWGCLVCTL